MNSLIGPDRTKLARALAAILFTSTLNLAGPALLGWGIDHPLARGDFAGVLRCGAVLLGMYLISLVSHYHQALWMGGVGQSVLFRVRQQLFMKLQELPVAFFQAHKSGDLVSRINNDTDRLNQFFSQSLMQFVGSTFTMTGSAVFLLALHPRLGAAALAPALVVAVLTRLLSPVVKARNAASLKSTGSISAEVSESLENFKAIVAYHRRDYFRERFAGANQDNYRSALGAGLANGVFLPIYSLCQQMAQLAVLIYGLALVGRGEATVGLLISFFVYVSRFYDPLRQLASLWATFQGALAGWDRIRAILEEKLALPQLPPVAAEPDAARLELRAVRFGYDPARPILHEVCLRLEAGKTYALVGPTGGGKTTTASLMARLYDPDQGEVLLDGRDLRTYTAAERARKIGFILQEPFMLAGTLRENGVTEEALGPLLDRFSQGLDTPVEGLSLGQRQIVAFARAVARKPDLLILDEATANIDTVTESILGHVLDQLPSHTTRVLIAHRLNTIENADQIYFVNDGHVVLAGSMEQAVAMLREGRRKS